MPDYLPTIFLTNFSPLEKNVRQEFPAKNVNIEGKNALERVVHFIGRQLNHGAPLLTLPGGELMYACVDHVPQRKCILFPLRYEHTRGNLWLIFKPSNFFMLFLFICFFFFFHFTFPCSFSSYSSSSFPLYLLYLPFFFFFFFCSFFFLHFFFLVVVLPFYSSYYYAIHKTQYLGFGGKEMQKRRSLASLYDWQALLFMSLSSIHQHVTVDPFSSIKKDKEERCRLPEESDYNKENNRICIVNKP